MAFIQSLKTKLNTAVSRWNAGTQNQDLLQYIVLLFRVGINLANSQDQQKTLSTKDDGQNWVVGAADIADEKEENHYPSAFDRELAEQLFIAGAEKNIAPALRQEIWAKFHPPNPDAVASLTQALGALNLGTVSPALATGGKHNHLRIWAEFMAPSPMEVKQIDELKDNTPGMTN